MAIAIIAMAQFGIKEMAHISSHNGMGAKVPPQISVARARHILYGDGRGGGHLHGENNPCKSEFPAGWTGPMILAIISRDAANDNLDWRHESNGNDVAEVTEDGVKIRIVVNGRHDEVITAYPLNTPRNPCPAANDNND